tara:strand:- start:469 stop:837 length:369 start_codon:yes stop_codon:yes gene_type:complete
MNDYWTDLLNYKTTMKKEVMTPFGVMENHSTHPNAMITYNFSNFKDAVDKQIQSRLGCSIHDLEDYPYADDWCECAEDLAFKAPEDTEAKDVVFRNHVLYTVENIVNECYNDANPYTQGVDY